MNRMNRMIANIEAEAAALALNENERRQRLSLDDLTAGEAVPAALEHAASSLEACRSLTDALAVLDALPAFMRRMAREVRGDYALAG